MKKIISLLLVLLMIMGLVACYLPIDPQQTTTGGMITLPTDEPTSPNPSTTLPSSTTTLPTSTTKPTSTTTKPTTTTGGNTSTTTSTTTSTIKPVEPSGEGEQMDVFYALFDYSNYITIKLDISKKELQKLQDDYNYYSSFGSKSPIYRMADMYITITKSNGEKLEYVIEQVGVRMKGNTSRTDFYNSNDGMYNLIHFKVSFQETFDDAEYYGNDALVWTNDAARKERKNRTFATLEKIDMRWNKNDDSTYIREIYAYDLYRENGVLAPHTNLASVDISGDHAGVFVIYEPIDKIFLEKYLPQEALGGDLYKLGWAGSNAATFTTFNYYGIEDEDACQFYVYDLKTNKKTSDHSSLKNLINTVKSSSCTKDSFTNLVDIDNFLMFSAVSYIIGNPDDLRNNYNNCYIYFRADTGKMMIIPYDMDRGLGVNKDWNPYGDHMVNDNPFSNKTVSGDQKNPLIKKGLLNTSFYKNEYAEAIKYVASSDILTVSYFRERFDLAKSLYANDTRPSKTYYNAGGHGFSFDLNKSNSSNLSFSEYITGKKNTIAKYISNYTPDSNNGSDSGSSGSGSDSGSSGSGTLLPVSEWELYLRGNFNDNNWENYRSYKLINLGNGLYSITVTATKSSGDPGTFKFKIFNQKQSGDEAWYNTVDETKVSVPFEYQGGNRNVQVELGTYTIYFDTNTQTIYFEKQ